MRRALISVYDKEGLIPFARGLMEMGIELIATSGTMKHILDAGIPAVDISSVIGMPAILSGRVKTLHPKIHGGILADRDKVEHVTQMRNLGLVSIDIVVVNMKPFSQEVSLDEFMNNIDTGGPSLIRSAARNYKHVLIVTNPEQYATVLKRLKTNTADEAFRANLAAVAFSATAHYDALITSYMAAKLSTAELFSPILPGHYIREAYLRHGENEHQNAAFYRNLMSPVTTIGLMKQLSGPGLTGAQLLSVDTGWECISVFKKPTVAIIKHANPVGVAVRNQITEAFQEAYVGDPRGNRGGIVALNRHLDEATARMMVENDRYFQSVIATGYEEGVVDILKKHPVWGNEIQIIEMPTLTPSRLSPATLRDFSGGLLLEETDDVEGESVSWRIVGRAKPTSQQLVDLAFALAIASKTKSAASVLAKDNATLGIGAGQPSSLESIAIAVSKAGTRAKQSVLGLDCPCIEPEAIQLLHEAGVTAIIQPPDNSRTTPDVIHTANGFGIPIVFCKRTHYRY